MGSFVEGKYLTENLQLVERVHRRIQHLRWLRIEVVLASLARFFTFSKKEEFYEVLTFPLNQPLKLLFLHSSILEPNFDLPVREVETVTEFLPLLPSDVGRGHVFLF